MNGFARFAITNARFLWLVIASVCIGGVYTYTTQPRQEDPEVTIRSAQIITRLPGLSPERIEQLVTRPIEETVKTIPEVEEIKSVSSTGLSIITPEVASRYSDMAPIWAKLRNKMDDLARDLPEGTLGPNVNDDYGTVAAITLALTGDEFTLAELREIARELQDELSTLSLVARVDLYGVQPERIWLEFDAAFMAQYRLQPQRIVSALRGQNVVLPGGTVDAGGQRIVVEPSGDLRSLDELRRVAVKTDTGQIVYLEDLATIRRGYVDPPEAPSFYNGKPAIVLGVSMVAKSNVVELGRQVTESLDRQRATLPLGMSLDVVIYQPELVQAAVHDATINLAQTVVVVLVVVMLFLGLRTGLIVGTMVPLTMMATLIGMALFGIELHRISIAAIIVALGLLVDNGVVIAEDIQKRLADGLDRRDAVLESPRHLAVPLLTSSLTTVAAFLPLMLISGGSGEFLKSLGQVLALALLGSWLIAITVTPAFCYWFLRSAGPPPASAPARREALAYRAYRGVLGILLRVRIVFVAAMVALLFGSVLILGSVKQRSLGPSERNQFTLYVDLPAEAPVAQTIDATRRLTHYLCAATENPEVTDVLAYVGSGGPRFFLSLNPNDPQPNKAFLVVNTRESDEIHAVMARAERFIIEALPEAQGRAETLFLGTAALGTVELQVTGPDIDTLRQLVGRVTDAFHGVPGIQAVRDDWENAVLKLRVDVDQERARRADVNSADVANTLSAYFDGETVTSYREGDLVIPIVIRARASDRGSLDRVRTVEVLSASSGAPVPLIQIASFDGEVEASKIRRFNQQRAWTVSAKHPAMTSAELFAALAPALDAVEVPLGYSIDVAGEILESRDSNAELFRYAPHAFLLILALLVLQFNSFRRPAVVLLTIPLVLIGANYGLFLFDGYFDFTAMLGLFSLAGIIINNGIVMIDRIDHARDGGLEVNAAIVDAALARARPIIMTTATTIVGLLPLALFGGEFWFGMAIVIMCGLGVGTVLTLGFVPVMYSLLFGGGKRSTPQGARG
ncbi:MAG: efflux RND transporter permease subunit [Planctomycetota bacterium]